MTRIAIIAGSTRPGRRSAVIAHWVLQAAAHHDNADFSVVDLADYHLPHLDEPVAAAMSADYQHEHTRRWAEAIASFDGYVFVTPEYNHGTTGVLKNAIDYLYTEWHHKAAGFVSYGTHGGVRAVEQLRLVMAELHIADVRAQVALSLSADFAGGNFTPAPHQTHTVDALLNQVAAWATALAPLRDYSR